MKISELTELITIKTAIYTVDEYGGNSSNLEEGATTIVYANIKPISSGITTSEGNTSEVEHWRDTLRYDSALDITLQTKIYWRFQYYTITSISNENEGKFRWVKLVINKLNI